MNAGEILELVRAGYTRAEIDAMSAPEEQHDDPQPEEQHDDPQPEEQHDDSQPEQAPAWAQALNNTLDELRKTIQASNIAHDDMGDEDDVVDAAENALAQYITGKAPEAKSKGGRKTK
jgi:hypothetical protein